MWYQAPPSKYALTPVFGRTLTCTCTCTYAGNWWHWDNAVVISYTYMYVGFCYVHTSCRMQHWLLFKDVYIVYHTNMPTCPRTEGTVDDKIPWWSRPCDGKRARHVWAMNEPWHVWAMNNSCLHVVWVNACFVVIGVSICWDMTVGRYTPSLAAHAWIIILILCSWYRWLWDGR